MVTADPLHAVVPAPAAAAVTKKAPKKASAPKKPTRSSPSHPTYLEMIGEAIASLKERTGSSQYAITKFVEDKHRAHLPPNFKKLILVQLRKLTASGKLVRIKNSYKLSSAAAVVATKPKAAVVAKQKKPATVAAGKKRPAAAVKPSARAAKSAKTSAKDAPAKKASKPAVKPKAKAAVAKVKKAAPLPAKAKKAARPKSVKKTPVRKSAPAKKAKE